MNTLETALQAICDRHATADVGLNFWFGSQGVLTIYSYDVRKLRAVTEAIRADAQRIRAELPGRALKWRSYGRGSRVTRNCEGYFIANLKVELTAEESASILTSGRLPS